MLSAIALFPGISPAAERLDDVAENFFLPDPGSDGDIDPVIGVALQETINDLYDGFLSQEDRVKLKKDGDVPDVRVSRPPRVELSARFDVLLPAYRPDHVIEFPAWLSHPDCLPAWVSLAHETAGHAILDAYGLVRKLRNGVTRQLGKAESAHWKRWFDEASSDCLAALNLGPAMTLGAIVSWRATGRLLQPERGAHLPCAAFEPGSSHPPPVVRAYLMAHATSLLRFRGASALGTALKRLIKGEVADCDCSKQRLRAAELFAEAILLEPRPALNGHCFSDLQNWEDRDEAIVGELRGVLRRERPPTTFEKRDLGGHYAAHALAAAILEQLSSPRRSAHARRVFRNLIRLLVLMYESDRGKRTRRRLLLRG